MLFESLVEIKIEIESRLHCIDIYDDDCTPKSNVFENPVLFSSSIHTLVSSYTRLTVVHLNIRAGPIFAVLLWTVPPIYNY